MEFLIIFTFISFLLSTDGLSGTIRLGGLFHTIDDIQELSFRYAVEYNNKAVLRNRLAAQTERVPENNSFQVSRTVCQLLKTGVAGIFGPPNAETSVIVQSICDAKEIPHIETRWNPFQSRGACSLNLYPHPSSLVRVLLDVINAWDWTSFTIIYQDEVSFSQFGEILKLQDPKGGAITVVQLEKGDNYRPVLRDVKNSGSTNIILDCSVQILPEVLKQAQQVGLMVAEYTYFITNLDLQTIDLEPIQYGGTNITGFSMVNPDDPFVIEAVERWTEEESKQGRILEVTPATVGIEAALMNDAVWLYSKALYSLQDSNMTNVEPIDCGSEDNWAHGCSIINIVRGNEIKGMTGVVKFDNQGFRTEFSLDLVELTEDGLKKIGTWNTSEGLNLTRAVGAVTVSNEDESLVNKSFIVLIAISPPYGMLKDDSRQLAGNDRFEGFGIDLIHELSLMLGFNYTYVVQEDNKYGSLNKNTKQWDGMMKELMEWRADLAITDLTITHDRESAVDFTMPFMTLGISILYKKPQKQPPSLFSFLSPFSNEVWMYVLGAYIGVSVLLFFMARISPYEWTNPYPCIEEPDELENQFSLKNSLWFTIGSLMQQGSEIAPIAVSTRMVAGIWWFFTLIMVSSYTANLAAFLTIESTTQAFRNIEELANQKVIKYGSKTGGSTASFFQDSNYTTYKKVWQYMFNNPDVMTTSNPEGLQRVLNENYAFLMESSSIEYIIERDCEVTQVGGLLDSKGYGIAMRKNSSYRNQLSAAVLQLQETGKLQELKRKWWKEKRGGGACDDVEGGGEASELDLDNVGGVFVVLVAGVFIACFITLFEMLWNIRQVSRKLKVNFKDELMEEIRFVSKCHGSTKPVRSRKNPDDDNGEDNEQFEENNVNYGWFDSNKEKKVPTP